MNPPESALSRAARWLTFGSAASILFSIAVSQILLGLALAALLALRRETAHAADQVAAGAVHAGHADCAGLLGDPVGRPAASAQVLRLSRIAGGVLRLRNLKVVRWLFLTWAGIGAITALRGFVQFAGKVQEAHRAGPEFLRVLRGPADHRLHQPLEHVLGRGDVRAHHGGRASAVRAARPPQLGLGLCGALIAAAVVLGETRGIWIATAAAAVYWSCSGGAGSVR